MTETTTHPAQALTEEDMARASMYGLLARLFYAAPDAELLQAICVADEIFAADAATPLADAWQKLQAASQLMETEAVATEYEAVFIGLAQGEVMPYMSWHLTGFMMEEPLSRLREDLAQLELARVRGVGEPEDHMAAICEVMRLLTAGSHDHGQAPVELQRQFFDRHLRPWYKKFSAQCLSAPSANYYRTVARFMETFMDVEAQAFDMGS